MLVVAAPDKFRGTARAGDVASAVAEAARSLGARSIEVPLSDGGEGFLDAFGGPNRTTTVTGPLGDPVEAGWRMAGRTAVIEMALASGLALVGGAEGNDPIAASTTGTGELVRAAIEAGARRILVGHGGSATTDGGLDALRALSPAARLTGIDLVAAVDVRTPFLDAAEVFAPQKGATPSQVTFLGRRLERLAQVYLDEHGVDVTAIPGAGAAGGLAGGLAVVGAQIESGFDLIAEEVDLAAAIEDADLVVTGEGFLDEASFDGKVVGGVVELAEELDVPVLVVAGAVYDDVGDRVEAISLVERFGEQRALSDTTACITEAVQDWIAANLPG
ncbi:MAG: glycerate kinase [Acidimicrobiales bacterium]|nr:glycerate kinase [Acidimicrobiales bacterium]